MAKKPRSLALRLFLSVCALNVVTMLVVGALGMRSANINISEDYDAQLITEASVLWEILEENAKNGDMGAFHGEVFDAEHGAAPLLERIEQDSLLDYAQWRAFRVWRGDKVMMHSDNTDEMPDKPFPQGFSDIPIDGDTWRVFALHDPDNHIVVETYENQSSRRVLELDILLDVLAPLAIMLPLLGVLFSFGITFSLKELRQLANRLATRSPSDLSRLSEDHVPKELRPLTGAVNTLLSTLESSLAHEREFIDHAAHELRTPLSALKLQAQLLAGSIRDPESKAFVNELLASVDRTAQLVDQLLLLSHVAQQDITLERVNLHTVAKDAIGLYALRIFDKHLNLTLHSDENLCVRAQTELLRIMLGTILDNAIKYTPGGGDILVSVERAGDRAMLSVTDTGEGIPDTERTRVFDRFYRVSHTKQSGSGLGLAIASQIAGLLHASIELETPPSGKGLRVAISLPLD